MGEDFQSSMLNQKIFEAYFVNGQNLVDQGPLANPAGKAGLSKSY